MERIFDGEVYDLILKNGELVLSYCKSSYESTVYVGYKMIGEDGKELLDVAKSVYLFSKFGNNFNASSELSSNYILAKTAELSNGFICIISDTGNAYLIDQNGMPVWTGNMDYRNEAPSDICAYKNSIWACYSDSGVLIRFNIKTMREELRIGGKNTPFNKPNNIFIEDNTATISNVGSNKLISVNLETYVVTEKEEFSESVYSYAAFKDKKYVLLESGLYIL
ncbi:MAG: hypothetical protein MJ090_00880 [Clostridia bacterium]|nr:hypothetical protein [Clostridia bacterium]